MAKQISALPTAPSTQRPATFNTEADAFVAALPTFVSEANALATEAATNAQRSEDANTTAQSAKESAQASAQTASEAKTAAIQGASSAESSAQAAAQIKTQTQAFADAAQSSAQAAKQSEQAAEQTKAELQTAAKALQDIKTVIKDGFIDDGTQSETKTYSSKKIAELNEALSADVTQKLDEASKEIRTAAMSGAMPSAYESDLAMWDYMEIKPVAISKDIPATAQYQYLSKLVFDGDVNFYTYDHTMVPIAFEGSNEILPFRKGDAVAIYNVEKTITLIDDDKAYVYCASGSSVRIFSAGKGMQNFSKNSQTPDRDPLQSFESKYLIYLDTSKKEAYVYTVDAAAGTLKYAFKKKIDDDKFSAYGSAYVAFNYLKIGDFTFKITDTDLTLASEGEIYLPKRLDGEIKAPLHRSSPGGFIISDGVVYNVKNGERFITSGLYGVTVAGFLGRSDYLLAYRTYNRDGQGNNLYSSFIYDVKNGARVVFMPDIYTPVNVVVKDEYAHVLMARSNKPIDQYYIGNIMCVVKVPTKYLTGKNLKG
jgi:hypothetical protein